MNKLSDEKNPVFERALQRVQDKSAVIGVVGLGYVGLPLAAASGKAGYTTIGFDVDEAKLPKLNAGTSYIDAVTDAELGQLLEAKLFHATGDMSEMSACDIIIICVPTPLTRQREPDMKYVVQTTNEIARTLRSGQTVVLESTTYPGTTAQLVRPILEATGLISGRDIFLGFSPEREDPGNKDFETANIPKVVAGDGPAAAAIVEAFYGQVVQQVVPVSTLDTAEAVKITENIFRAVNIALVNELKVIYDEMGIDVWEVIDAAKTKPFGYMPFYPGPGLGGHCVPIDPYYLTWKAREFEVSTRFIELAGEINTAMPRYVVRRMAEALDRRLGRPLGGAKILMIGLAYKKNVSDTRESPGLRIMELIEQQGASCDFHDPHVDKLPPTRRYPQLSGRVSVKLSPDMVSRYDGVVIVTDHDNIDYTMLAAHARLVVDTRNVFARLGLESKNVVKA